MALQACHWRNVQYSSLACPRSQLLSSLSSARVTLYTGSVISVPGLILSDKQPDSESYLAHFAGARRWTCICTPLWYMHAALSSHYCACQGVRSQIAADGVFASSTAAIVSAHAVGYGIQTSSADPFYRMSYSFCSCINHKSDTGAYCRHGHAGLQNQL